MISHGPQFSHSVCYFLTKLVSIFLQAQLSHQINIVALVDFSRYWCPHQVKISICLMFPLSSALLWVSCSLANFSYLMWFTIGTTFSCRYRSLVQTIRELRGNKLVLRTAPRLEAPIMPVRPIPAVEEDKEEEEPPPQTPLQNSSTVRSSSRRLWKGPQQVPLTHHCLHVISWCR